MNGVFSRHVVRPLWQRGLVGIVDFGDPFVDPQRIEEPRVVAAFGRKGETGVLRHVVVAQGEILARGLFALLNGRIEQEGSGGKRHRNPRG